MIKNITYRQPEDMAMVDRLVGPQHNFWNRLKSVYYSPRFIINGASININKHLIRAHNINHSTIERRNDGIIVNYFSVLNHYAWAIPFKDLSIKKHKNDYTISDQHNFIRYSYKSITRSHQNFLDRLIFEQRQYLQQSTKNIKEAI